MNGAAFGVGLTAWGPVETTLQSCAEPNSIKFDKRRSIHAPSLIDKLGTAQKRRLNQFGSAG